MAPQQCEPLLNSIPTYERRSHYDVMRARNRRIVSETGRRLRKRSRKRTTPSAPLLVRSFTRNWPRSCTLQITWYIVPTTQEYRLDEMGEYIFSRMIRDACSVLDGPRTTEEPFARGESRGNSEHLFIQVKYVPRRHRLEDHERQRRVRQRRRWTTGRTERLSDYEILEQPRMITT